MNARFHPITDSTLRAVPFAAAGFFHTSFARAAVATADAASGVVTAGSMLQVVMGLGVVLLIVAAIAWMLKRFASHAPGTNGNLRIVAGAAVGQRERVVIVEVGTTWLLVGVAPGQVRALHTLPKPDSQSPIAPARSDGGFAASLKKIMEWRRAN